MNATPPLKLHWSSSLKDDKKNFGDWLSPILIQHLSGREIVHATPNQADIVAVGSLLQRLKNNFWNGKTNIWGAGFIAEQQPVKFIHKIHAIRGKKSAALIKNATVESFGDPGLLVDLLLPNFSNIPKVHKVGIICHYSDAKHPLMQAFKSQHPEYVYIDIFSETFDFMRQVNSCEFIYSSSLHGLVTADAFGIPNNWLKISNALRGGDFKFHDYYSVFDEPIPIASYLGDIDREKIYRLTNDYSRKNIYKVKQSLLATFPYKKV